jgi:hypothetical protein
MKSRFWVSCVDTIVKGCTEACSRGLDTFSDWCTVGRIVFLTML